MMLPNLILQRAFPATGFRLQTQLVNKSLRRARKRRMLGINFGSDQLNVTGRVWCHLVVIGVHVRRFPSLLVHVCFMEWENYFRCQWHWNRSAHPVYSRGRTVPLSHRKLLRCLLGACEKKTCHDATDAHKMKQCLMRSTLQRMLPPKMFQCILKVGHIRSTVIFLGESQSKSLQLVHQCVSRCVYSSRFVTTRTRCDL